MINYIIASFQKTTQKPLYKLASLAFIAISLGLIATYMDLSGADTNIIIIFILVACLPFYICFYSMVRYFPKLKSFIGNQLFPTARTPILKRAEEDFITVLSHTIPEIEFPKELSILSKKEPHHWYSIKAKLPPTSHLVLELLIKNKENTDSIIKLLTQGARKRGVKFEERETTARERTWAKFFILQTLRQFRQLVIQESLSDYPKRRKSKSVLSILI